MRRLGSYVLSIFEVAAAIPGYATIAVMRFWLGWESSHSEQPSTNTGEPSEDA